jgi:hypothetical protein
MKLNRRDFLKSVAALLAAVPLSKIPLETDAPLPTMDNEDEWLEDDSAPLDEDGIAIDQSLLDAVRDREASHHQTLHINSPLASFEVVTYTPGGQWLSLPPETTVYATWAGMAQRDVESLHLAMRQREKVMIDLSPAPYCATGILTELAVERGMGIDCVRATIRCTGTLEVR